MAGQSEQERALRLVEIAVMHTPSDQQSCFECAGPWPCFTFIAATGMGDG